MLGIRFVRLLFLVSAFLVVSNCSQSGASYRGHAFEIVYQNYDRIVGSENTIDAKYYRLCYEGSRCAFIYEGNNPTRYNRGMKSIEVEFFGILADRYAGDKYIEYIMLSDKEWPRLIQIYMEKENEAFFLKNISSFRKLS